MIQPARTEPPLNEALRLLLPLAPRLQKLDLGGNQLGGMITSEIAKFEKLTKLGLYSMNLDEGACINADSNEEISYVTLRR